MRPLVLFVTGLVLTACDAGPAPGADDLPPEAAHEAAHELTWPARPASSLDLFLYAELGEAGAALTTELHYGLADGYPRQVTLTAEQGVILDRACDLLPGAVVWRSIAELRGAAATLAVVDGGLAIDLREEGTVTAVLVGELRGQACEVDGGPLPAVVPLTHQLVLHVDRVAGFVVEQTQQRLGGCGDALVLPSDAPLFAPTALALDAAGQPFAPANAPAPVAITLRSDGALAAGDDDWLFSAGPGEVSLSLDTTLPARGLSSFAVVGPATLTGVSAALYLNRAAAKGGLSERLEDGSSYPLFFPERRNTVDLRLEGATTTRGKLCANPPAAWFTATSATPGRCEADVGDPDDLAANPLPVATLRAPGECRLEVTIADTEFAWSTAFRTTI